MMKNKTNAAVFIPHLGCPHKCSFCDQNRITKAAKSVTSDDVSAILDKHVLSLQRRSMTAEIAFFGGTFTALDRDYREDLLSTANYYLKKHSALFTGIRCSTRPDYVDEIVLEQLKKHGVTAIELGAQSMDDEVLRLNERGHTSDDVRKSARLIKAFGFEPGLQMMTGLLGDTREKSLYTCDELVALKPDTVRIYPTVVLPGTRLAEINHEPFSLDETIELCAEIYGRFIENNIRVIRLGLNISGYSTPIGELSIGRYYYKKMLAFMQKCETTKFKVYTDRKNISKINGHKCENKTKLEKLGFTYKIKEKQGEDLLIEPV
jgi:histone acetyltransferase (RNA polymerase elongator complex component)